MEKHKIIIQANADVTQLWAIFSLSIWVENQANMVPTLAPKAAISTLDRKTWSESYDVCFTIQQRSDG